MWEDGSCVVCNTNCLWISGVDGLLYEKKVCGEGCLRILEVMDRVVSDQVSVIQAQKEFKDRPLELAYSPTTRESMDRDYHFLSERGLIAKVNSRIQKELTRDPR